MAHVDTKDLKEKIDVQDLLEEYSLDKIKDEGEWVKSVCPYHSDSNPSFSMRKSDTYFHCWSCEAKGDAIQFIMDMDSVSFKEALDKLMAISGYIVTEGSQLEYLKKIWFHKDKNIEESEPDLLEDSNILKLNKLSNEWFVEELPVSVAKVYIEERKFSLELCRELGIGFYPKGFVNKATRDWGFSHEELYAAGFLRGDGSERFTGRITFPIYNESGNIVAFTARSLDGSDPKYSNTPNSPFYKKGYFLFGLQTLRAGEPITLVEGNFDFVRLASKGINCLATLGGTFSEKQASIIKKYTNKITLLYDGDIAGRKAAIRTFLVLLKYGLQISVINLPEGEDPDTYIVDDKQVTSIDAVMHYVNYEKDGGIKMPRILSILLSKVAKIQEREERALYIEKLAEIFDLSLETIQSELKKS